MNTQHDPENSFFSVQTHVMTAELMDAMDCIVWSPEAPDWFQEFFKAVDEGDEFSVTAEQACWIIETAEESLKLSDNDEGHSEYFQIIFDTFDDYTNFIKMTSSESDLADIAKITLEKK